MEKFYIVKRDNPGKNHFIVKMKIVKKNATRHLVINGDEWCSNDFGNIILMHFYNLFVKNKMEYN